MDKDTLFFELKNFLCSDMPLAAWLESPYLLYQQPHTHDCFEIIFVSSGTGWCAVNNLRFPMLLGDLYIIRPEDSHEFSGNPGLKFYNLMFSGDFFTAGEYMDFQPLLRDYGKLTIPNAARERIEPMLVELTEELKSSRPGHQVAAKAIFLRFMVELLRYRDSHFIATASSRDSKLVAKAFEFIHLNCRKKLTLIDLGKVFGCSPEYAGRFFKRLTGITFSDYLIRYRVDLACGRLENTNKSISEIAAELGYFDNAYFDKCFRKIMGMSPLDYRRLTIRNNSGKRK